MQTFDKEIYVKSSVFKSSGWDRLKSKLVTIKCHQILILLLYRISSKSPHMLTWFLYIFCMRHQFNFYQQWQSQSPNICVRGRKGIHTQKYPQNHILMSTPLFRAVLLLRFCFCKNISSTGFLSIPYLYKIFFPFSNGDHSFWLLHQQYLLICSFNFGEAILFLFSVGLGWKWVPQFTGSSASLIP